MLLGPTKARRILSKAGSTDFINYAELILRMIPAVGLILVADVSRFSMFFKVLGWFMLVTSLILLFMPRRIHHGYSLKCAEILEPLYFRLISPLAFVFGAVVIYSVL